MKFNTSQFEKLADAKKNYDGVVKSIGKDAILQVVRQLMDAYPQVTGVQWDQYTPYFCDGDPCYFSVNDVKIRFKQDIDELEDEAEFDYCWDLGKDVDEQLKRDAAELTNLLQAAEDALEVAFGDHVTVTVTKDGIEIDDCEHD